MKITTVLLVLAGIVSAQDHSSWENRMHWETVAADTAKLVDTTTWHSSPVRSQARTQEARSSEAKMPVSSTEQSLQRIADDVHTMSMWHTFWSVTAIIGAVYVLLVHH